MFTSSVLTLRSSLRHLAVWFKSYIQNNKTKSHNRNLESLVYKELYDQVPCLNSKAISLIQARVMSCVALTTQ